MYIGDFLSQLYIRIFDRPYGQTQTGGVILGYNCIGCVTKPIIRQFYTKRYIQLVVFVATQLFIEECFMKKPIYSYMYTLPVCVSFIIFKVCPQPIDLCFLPLSEYIPLVQFHTFISSLHYTFAWDNTVYSYYQMF